MPFLPAYAVGIVEPPAGGHPRSVAHGSVHNESVGRLSMVQLVREGFETATVTVYTQSAVGSEASEDRECIIEYCLLLGTFRSKC